MQGKKKKKKRRRRRRKERKINEKRRNKERKKKSKIVIIRKYSPRVVLDDINRVEKLFNNTVDFNEMEKNFKKCLIWNQKKAQNFKKEGVVLGDMELSLEE